jgi:hypothetical protein
MPEESFDSSGEAREKLSDKSSLSRIIFAAWVFSNSP